MPNVNRFKLGIIGADTTHVSAFVDLITHDDRFNTTFTIHTVVRDVYASCVFCQDREATITKAVEALGHTVTTDDTALQACDGFLVLACDSASHVPWVKRLIEFKKPIFIDKPMTQSYEEAVQLFKWCESAEVPCFSSSSLRFTSCVQDAKRAMKPNSVVRVSAPLSFQEGFEGYYWYGIHGLEMMMTLTQGEFKAGNIIISDEEERIYDAHRGMQWSYTGIKKGDPPFQICIDDVIYALDEPLYDALLREICIFMKTQTVPVSHGETLAILKEIETINTLRS